MADAASDVPRQVLGLARALVASARSRALYPCEHPAVAASFDRLRDAIGQATCELPLALGITPSALLLDEGPPLDHGPAAEAAALLHQRDLLRIVFAPGVPPATVREFVELIASEPSALRERGGPAEIWRTTALGGIDITQVDYAKVLEDREPTAAARRDDLWQAIVRSVLDRTTILDEAVQCRLLEIAGSPEAIGELAGDVMAPNCTPDGSPLVTTQAAAVIAAYNHLHNIVAVLAPDRREEMFRNLASATARLDARVVAQMIRGTQAGNPAAAHSTAGVMKGVAAAFDDAKVAQLLATTLALEGQASARLAEVFETIAPDEDRRHRVLRLTRSLLHETEFGRRDEFETLWQSMEELLMTYNERPFVSEDYRAGLDRAGERASHMGAAQLPPELPEWLETLGQDSVRRLSVTLLIDLLKIETEAPRASGLAGDLCALAEDMLLAGDYESAAQIASALAGRAKDRHAPGRDACALALDQLGTATATREAMALLDDLDERAYAEFRGFCGAVGAAVVEVLRDAIGFEDGHHERARTRASEIIIAFGAPGIARLAPLTGASAWHILRNACGLLEAIAAPEGVPLLQPLLRSRDPRVVQRAVKALSAIDDPAAARAVHTVLRAAAGASRQAVVHALAAERDPRVIPVLVRILSESDPLGPDHAVVLDTLQALGMLGSVVTDPAVGTVSTVIRRRRWFARRKAHALAAAGVSTLRLVGTPAARQALAEAAHHGDRLLRRVAGEA